MNVIDRFYEIRREISERPGRDSSATSREHMFGYPQPVNKDAAFLIAAILTLAEAVQHAKP